MIDMAIATMNDRDLEGTLGRVLKFVNANY